MNQTQYIITVIDIYTSKIVTIAGRLDDSGNLVIIGKSSRPVNPLISDAALEIEKIVDAISITVNEVQKQAGIIISEAYFGIAGLQIFCSMVNILKIEIESCFRLINSQSR
jgi:cell division ATPase FtsA